jgi:signal-transduction protein with cAMP-binding, CBS, and nucleotidyltransferase domain
MPRNRRASGPTDAWGLSRSSEVVMRVGEICKRSVVTCQRGASALELARLMRERRVGDVVVVDADTAKPTPIGIVTDRDLVVEVMAKGVDPDMLRAEEMIVGELVTVLETELVYDAIWHMRSNAVRRLPVVDAHGRLSGILTADDVTRFLAQELTELARVAPPANP